MTSAFQTKQCSGCETVLYDIHSCKFIESSTLPLGLQFKVVLSSLTI